MSHASTNGLESGLQRPDFWELTNFGTNEISLQGYVWSDADEKPFENRTPFPPTTIKPRESIIFVRRSDIVPDAPAFRAWWGINLPAGLQIYISPLNAPGFDDARGDAVRLWDANSNLVDEVRFDSAHLGVTFTYDTNSGAFSEFSEAGVAGAFHSAEGADIGSPGYAPCGPVPLRITQHPVSQNVNPGSEVILEVQATGRPAAQYQWYTNGVPIEPSGTQFSGTPRLVCFVGCGPSWRRPPDPNDLVLQNVEPWQGGNYFVEAFNGLERTTSAVVTIAVNTNASRAEVDCPAEEPCVPCASTPSMATLVADRGQSAIFTVKIGGFPTPALQWSRSADGVNFTELPGQTGRDLILGNLQDSDAGIYRARLQNDLGTTSAVARLIIKASPRLEITEVMAKACSALDRDWWELTNTNSEPVNLCGYRWDDETARGAYSALSIGGGPTITNNVIVQPGASVILMESQTEEAFVQWWGASNLPPNLQFVTYGHNGFGEMGDYIYVWGPNETDGSRPVASAVFSTSVQGITRWFDSFMVVQESCTNAESGIVSSNGFCGAFQAHQGCEIGSPGWTRWTPPTLTSVRRQGSETVLNWSAQPGSINRIQFARHLAVPLAATVWEDLGEFQSAQAACVGIDSTIEAEPQRFYRVMRVASAGCPCPEDDF